MIRRRDARTKKPQIQPFLPPETEMNPFIKEKKEEESIQIETTADSLSYKEQPKKKKERKEKKKTSQTDEFYNAPSDFSNMDIEIPTNFVTCLSIVQQEVSELQKSTQQLRSQIREIQNSKVKESNLSLRHNSTIVNPKPRFTNTLKKLFFFLFIFIWPFVCHFLLQFLSSKWKLQKLLLLIEWIKKIKKI